LVTKSRGGGHGSLVSYTVSAATCAMSESPAASEQDDASAAAVPLDLAAIFRAYHAFVYRCVRRLGVPEGAAEDTTQEVFLVVQRRLPDYEERGSMRSWLYRIAQRVASTQKRGQMRAQRRIERVEAPEPERLPDELLARREAANAVREFLDRLDEDQRIVFVLADMEGMRANEIALAVGARVNTVYSRLRIAREKFNRFVARRSARDPEARDGTAD
jgi:RNA polymerase sigma-70 factor (ECF subfamily)